MDEEKGTKSADSGRGDGSTMDDMAEPSPHIGLDADEFEERARVEAHNRGGRIERDHHVDLSKEEYTADEVAHMVGASVDSVMHAVRRGELKAERVGQNVVCIRHEDVTDWLRRRASGSSDS